LLSKGEEDVRQRTVVESSPLPPQHLMSHNMRKKKSMIWQLETILARKTLDMDALGPLFCPTPYCLSTLLLCHVPCHCNIREKDKKKSRHHKIASANSASSS
jgi:hypothetical protein